MGADEADDLFQRVRDARERVRACEGSILHSELAAVGRMYHVFATNEQELVRHLRANKDVQAMMELWDAKHPERFEAFLAETDRLLHNYLAAAASLADHTIRLWRNYPPDDAELTAEYKRRVEETFKDAPLANFIQGLRNLSVHRQLPIIQGTLSWTTGENASMTAITSLDKNALLAWDRWKAGAKTYLREAGDELNLEEVVAAYTTSVHNFNQWFGEEFVGGHEAAFAELRDLAAEHDALIPKWATDE